MAYEEAALIVDQKLVEFCCDGIGDTKTFGDPAKDRVQHRRPMFAADPHLLRRDLPCASNLDVDQGVGAPAIRGAFRGSDKLLCLHRQKRQCDRTNAIDLESRRKEFDPAGGKKIPRATNRAEDIGEFCGERSHVSSANYRTKPRFQGPPLGSMTQGRSTIGSYWE